MSYDERMQAEKALMRNTLSTLASLLDAANSQLEILSHLEEMPATAYLNLKKAVETADGIAVMLLTK